jgi:hypothetical protein
MRSLHLLFAMAAIAAGATLVAGCLAPDNDCGLYYCGVGGGGAAGAAGTAGTGTPGGTGGTGSTEKCSKDTPCDNGAVCNDGGEDQDDYCKSNFCADGVCCDKACEGTCEACTMALTGQATGTCAPIPTGDPEDECATGDGSECANTGECDGATAACALVSCTLLNAETTRCEAGKCAVETCMAGFGDCDMVADNGCELDVSTDIGNCGTCGVVCAPANATGKCENSMCLIETCNAGAEDCDADQATGCEALLDTDVNNCGKCGRACSAANVASRSCLAGRCDSTCDVGYANCAQPDAATDDDGCEKPGSDTHCGGCNNQCYLQGTSGGFVCQLGTTCACTTDAQCNKAGNPMGTCGPTGECICGGTTCNSGEACRHVGAVDVCSCEGNAAQPCAAGQTCCQTPKGCRDLQTDAGSCGGCGHVCAAGFACNAGVCGCDGDDDCSAGKDGTCDLARGLCSCGGVACGVGERCQADGTCG